MKVKTADLVEAATEDVFRWFGACETPDECHKLAGELREMVGSVAASHAEWLSRDGAPRPDPLRARPSEDGAGLPEVPFAVRRDPHDPLYTFDCSWCCGVDLLRAEKEPVGRTTLPFRDFPRQFTRRVGATVYRVDEETPDGLRLHGHVAVADYHGGWLVWLADDLACDQPGGGARREVAYSREADGDALDSALAASRTEDDAPEPGFRATLGEEVAVVPVDGGNSVAAVLREANGTRRWVPIGEPEEDWWAALSESGERLPGDWEYDRDAGTVVCSAV